jgi:hypothetical protein
MNGTEHTVGTQEPGMDRPTAVVFLRDEVIDILAEALCLLICDATWRNGKVCVRFLPRIRQREVTSPASEISKKGAKQASESAGTEESAAITRCYDLIRGPEEVS